MGKITLQPALLSAWQHCRAGVDPLSVPPVPAQLQLSGQPAPQWDVQLRLFPGAHIVAVARAPAAVLDAVR